VDQAHTRLRRVPAALRYVIAGGLNTLIYIGLTLFLSGPLGLPIQVAIPLAFGTALCTHFALQRVVVFGHVETYALPGHQQAGRYLAIAAVQYPLTALSTAAIPTITGWSEQAVYVVTAILIAAVTFLLLRKRVFHAATDG
jgi:putative flippase GtrA